jgi:hypothetical protein
MVVAISTDAWTAIGSLAGVGALFIGLIALLRPHRDHPPTPPGLEPESPPIPDFELEISWGWPTYHDGSIGEDSITLTLYNRRHHPVKWGSASIELHDGRHMPVMNFMVPPGMGLPVMVQAQDNHILLAAVEALRNAGIDLGKPIAGRATLGTGEVIRSEQRVFETAD